MKPQIENFFDPETWTFTYVVSCDSSSSCILIDPVLNYDPKSDVRGLNQQIKL